MRLFPVTVRFDKERQKNSKVPAVPKGVSWQEYQASDAELARAKNVGAIVPDGRVVIDLDLHKGVTREAVEQALGCVLDWDAALLQSTVSGGEHYCFALPEGCSVRQGSDLLGVDGFDTRAAGKGWICTGEGYTDESFYMGMPDSLYKMPVPTLPAEAVAKLADGAVSRWHSPMGDDDLSGLDAAVQERPLEGLTLDMAAEYLERLPGEVLDNYDLWLDVGMGLHHQFDGSAEALDLWIEASRRSPKFEESAFRKRWRGFKSNRSGGRVITFASVRKMVRDSGAGDVMTQRLCDELIEAAEAVDSFAGYEALKARLLAIGRKELPDDNREVIAGVLYKSYGKGAGLTRATLRKQLTPKRSKDTEDGADDRPKPAWVQDWVYCQAPAVFSNVVQGRHIKREAFNAAYDREPECMNNPEFQVRASDYALIHARIPAVADTMYWPGADRFFEADNGSTMLNTYYPSGVDAVPASEQNDEEQAAVGRFLEHIDLLIDEPQERQVVLDWLSYVYQHPGEKLTWALLIQGGEGVGKSYLGSLMQMLLGNNARTIDAGAITGRFNSWAHGSVLVTIEEIKISGENKYDIIDKLKPIISNETVSIEEKGRDIRMVPNFTNYLLFTNHKDALPIGENDRRYAVIFSRFQSAAQLHQHFGGDAGAQAYFDQLFADLREHAGAIGGFLQAHKQHSSFAPKGRAPITASKARMQSFSISETDDYIDAAIEEGCPIITHDFIDATWLTEIAVMSGTEVPKTKAMGAALRAKGYEPIPSRRVKISKGVGSPTYHYLWAKPSFPEDVVKQAARDFFQNRAPDDDAAADFDIAPF